MKPIQNFFIRAKDWQMFAAFAGLWCAGTAALLLEMFSTHRKSFANSLSFFVVMEIVAILFSLWLWSAGEFLNAIVPRQFKMKMAFFRVSIFLLPLCLPFFALLFQSVNTTLILIMVVVHFVATFSEIYSWYFVSKSLALAERSKRVTFAAYKGYLLGLWFFPFGVWFIQRRINRLYANATQTLSS